MIDKNRIMFVDGEPLNETKLREIFTVNPDFTNGGLWARLPREPIFVEKRGISLRMLLILMSFGATVIFCVIWGIFWIVS